MAIGAVVISMSLIVALLIVGTRKARIHTVVRTVTHTNTQYVRVPSPLTWGVGACAQNGPGTEIDLVSCSGSFDWVVVSEVSDSASCIYFSTNGGLSSQDEYVPNDQNNGYFCLVP